MPDWLRQLTGDDFFAAVGTVNLSDQQVSADQIAALQQLQPRSIDFSGASVSPENLVGLSQIRWLADLRLNRTSTTDEMLVQLAAVRGLRHLTVVNTAVTTDGVRKFKTLRPNCTVVFGTFDDPQISYPVPMGALRYEADALEPTEENSAEEKPAEEKPAEEK